MVATDGYERVRLQMGISLIRMKVSDFDGIVDPNEDEDFDSDGK
jgi:hypothetical protein